jgi:MFS superfamily sulfate permease-like transporter
VVVVTVTVMRRVAPRLPMALVVVVIGIAVSEAADLEAHGVDVVGPIPAGLPKFQIPSASAADVRHLLPVAIGVFLVSFADSILTARSYAGQHDQHVDANQELVALGMANIASSVTQGFTPSASGSRTAVNDQMGARTQIAGLFSVALVAIVLLFLTGPMQYLPTPVLAALIVTAAIGIIDPNAWRSLAASGRFPVVIAITTAVGVVLLGILHALLIAVALSVVEIIARGSRPHDAVLGFVPRIDRYGDVRFHRTAIVTPGVVTYRLDDRMFFANAGYVTGRINEAIAGAPTETSVVVFDAERVPGIDVTATDALKKLIVSLRRQGIEFVIARAGRAVLEQLERAGAIDLLGADHVQPTVHGAVAAAVRLRDA